MSAGAGHRPICDSTQPTPAAWSRPALEAQEKRPRGETSLSHITMRPGERPHATGTTLGLTRCFSLQPYSQRFSCAVPVEANFLAATIRSWALFPSQVERRRRAYGLARPAVVQTPADALMRDQAREERIARARVFLVLFGQPYRINDMAVRRFRHLLRRNDCRVGAFNSGQTRTDTVRSSWEGRPESWP
jgi:hypothetical protein